MADKNPTDTTRDEVTGEKLSDGELIARRSADIEGKTAAEHEKVFVLGPVAKPTEKSGYDHGPNKAATRQYAISNGLRPTGDVELVSITQHEDGKSWYVKYRLPVSPSENFDRASGPDIVPNGPTDNTEPDNTKPDEPTA